MNKTSWEQQIGGRIGHKFRESLSDKSGRLLRAFVNNYPVEAQELLRSSEIALGNFHPELSKAMQGKDKLDHSLSKTATPHQALYTTLGLCLLLCLTLSVTIYAASNLRKSKTTRAEQPSIVAPDKSLNVQGASAQELATLENKDAGYTIKYPSNFDAMYSQDGIEFTPKNGPGKITLQVKDGVVEVSINADHVNQPALSMLNEAAQTIKNTFQIIQPTPTDKTRDEGRFSNLHFDPRKY